MSSIIDIKEIECIKLDCGSFVDQTFDAGEDEFTEYYKFQSRYDLQEKLAQTYLFQYREKIVGYVSLAMAHIRKETTPEMNEKETSENIHVMLISHLATHINYQRNGIGTLLLNYAYEIAVNASKNIGCRYIILRPRDDDGVRCFYKNYGFRYIHDTNNDSSEDLFVLDLKRNRD